MLVVFPTFPFPVSCHPPLSISCSIGCLCAKVCAKFCCVDEGDCGVVCADQRGGDSSNCVIKFYTATNFFTTGGRRTAGEVTSADRATSCPLRERFAKISKITRQRTIILGFFLFFGEIEKISLSFKGLNWMEM